MRDQVWAWLPRDQEGRIAASSGELLYEARALGRRLGASLVLISDRKPDARVNALIKAWQVDELRVLKSRPAPHPAFDGKTSALAELDALKPPRAFLLPADSFGRVAAPLWAAESASQLVTGATGVTADSSRFAVARPTLGDRYESVEFPPLDAPLVVTLVPGAVGDFAPPAAGAEKSGGEPPAAGAGKSGRARSKTGPAALAFRIHPPDPATLDIADAERIVAFGRGAFDDKAVKLVEQLARKLGAAVAGTRPAADEGWLPFSRQVGLTGAIVRPRLYVAIGISGAPYHMVGVKDVSTLVAVNKDAEAPIFACANLGIVGDLHEVLPRLIEEIGQGDDLLSLGAGRAGRRNG